MKPYCAYGIIWVPLSQLAKEYNKSRMTILRWIADGFILQLGYHAHRDPSGYWFIGKHL